jgi:hypothetical protein
MHDDDLRKLLRTADAGAETPLVDGGELAARVRRADLRRRRLARIMLAATPIVLAGAVIGWAIVPLEKQVRPDPGVELAQIERLRVQAEFHERQARELIARVERERGLTSTPDAAQQADPLDEVREQVDVVAYQMILRADGLQAGMMASREAIELYRKVLRLFPKTYSAQVARDRLSGLGASVEET